MKKIYLFTFAFFCLFGEITAQTFSPNQTYTYTRVFLDSVAVGSSNYTTAQSKQVVQYTDGLGRVTQTVAINAIKPNQDIVSSSFYEPDGRQTKQYLPISIASQNGLLQPVTEADINSYHGTTNAYSEVAFDNSPLNRIIKKASPGTDWSITSTHTQDFSYEFNEATTVKKYSATLNTSTFDNSLDDNGFYTVNTLYKTAVKDEDGNISSAYKNGLGQTIMSRVNGAVNLDTYYVYNQYNQLAYIIPPLNIGEDILIEKDKIAYQYKYDALGRVVEKKLPGKGKEYYVYDKENRVIMSTDSKLLADGKWSFIKYDQLGRTIYTGLCSGGTRVTEQGNADLSTVFLETRTSGIEFYALAQAVYYTKNSYPSTFTDILSINYYDEYPSGLTVTRPSDIYSQPLLSAAIVTEPSTLLANHSTKSLLTASFVKNVENNAWSKTLFWYDTKERLIGNHKISSMTKVTRTEMKLDFPGNITESKVYHGATAENPNVVIKQRYVYSSQNLLKKHYHQVDSEQEELLEDLTYDDLGRVTNKKVGNNLQSMDYTYNIRGWLTSINDPENLGTDLFAFKINFNQREGVETPNNDFSHLQVKPKYNGSISETAWSTMEGYTRRYGYVYDESGRLKAGLFQADEDPYNKSHSEILSYDNRGNIETLYRTADKPLKGSVRVIDNLDYANDGNRVTNINDLSGNKSGYQGGNGTIQYDINGNITVMPDKKITNISYNYLNLPSVINETNKTSFLYSADGTKLRKTLTVYSDQGNAQVVTEYIDGFQYSTPNTKPLNNLLTPSMSEGAELASTASEPEAFFAERLPVQPPGPINVLELAFFPTSEGFYDYQNKKYIYQYKDHLGNVRINYTQNADGSAVALNYNTYYAFGMNHLNSSNNSVYNPLGAPYNYKYNGKELQETGMYDYGWRMYMPDIGRWNGMDQLSEKFISSSPYAYVMNNPAMFFDPDGRLSQSFINNLWNSASGTTWNNNNDGSFSNNWGDTMSNDGIGMNFNSSTGFYGGRGGGGAYSSGGGYIDIPGITLTGKSSGWGSQIQGHFNSFMELSNRIDSFFDRVNSYPAVDFPGFIEKNFNGGLGYIQVGTNAYQRIPNDIKRHYAYKISKFTGMKSGAIYQNSKAFMGNVGKVAGKLGKASTALSVVAGAMDILDDGQVKASTVTNGILLGVGLAFPVTAPFILTYGILDYTFDIGDKLDSEFGTFNTHIYD